MTKSKNGNGNYEVSLNDWAKQEMIANEFITVLSKLFYNKSIELVLFRSQLIDRSASLILYRHSYAENIINEKLNIKDSLKLAKAILHCNIRPSKIDIGKLNGEWIESRENYVDAEDFIRIKLKDFFGPGKISKKPVDVVLYGFGRIGRLLARELIIQGNGHQLRVRAIVTRGNDETAIIPFTADSEGIDLHYCSETEINSYVVCNGPDCVLCKIGRRKEERLLLPVYLPASGCVGILPVSRSLRPYALLPQISNVLKSDTLMVMFVIREVGKYMISTKSLEKDMDGGELQIKEFLEDYAAGSINLIDLYPKIDNEQLLGVDGIQKMAALKGIKGNDSN